MNTTTKASLGATVLLLVIALVFAVQNMTELKSARQAIADRDEQIGQMVAQSRQMSDQLKHEREMNRMLFARTETASGTAPGGLEDRLSALEVELQKKASEIAAQEAEQKLLVNRVQEREVIREKELTETQRKIRDAASIGEVSAVQDELGFAVITAGKKDGVEPGINFAIRRDVFIVGKVTVDRVEDANSSIVNIVPGSVQPGLKIQPGDTVIAFPIY